MSPTPTPASAATGAFDLKAMLQELKGNRRTQLALGAFAVVLIYAAYTLFAPTAPRARRGATVGAATGLDSRQLQGLRRLPDLAALNRAGEVPSNPKVRRDLFARPALRVGEDQQHRAASAAGRSQLARAAADQARRAGRPRLLSGLRAARRQPRRSR